MGSAIMVSSFLAFLPMGISSQEMLVFGVIALILFGKRLPEVARSLGKGVTDFHAVRKLLLDAGYQGWCTVEQDCDPTGPTSPVDDARANRAYLSSIGFN